MERVMGLDLGSRTLGIAVSDPLGMIARTVETYRFSDDDYESACNRAVELAKELGATKFVLGLPKHMNGDVGIRGQVSIRFKEMLEEKLPNIPVILQDERLTTAAAERILISADVSRKKRKAVIDQMAAVQILQSYLDQKR